jgi:hypothetical protein
LPTNPFCNKKIQKSKIFFRVPRQQKWHTLELLVTGNGTPPIVDMGAYEFFRSDIDYNGKVNLKDFSQLALYWLDIACGDCSGADLTCDGNVSADDLRELAYHWLAGK